VSDWLRVVPEDLQLSAGTVDVRADGVLAKHVAADGRIEAAQVGLPAGSAVALNSAVAKWQGNTAALFGRMVDHSAGLRAGASLYQQADTDGASEIDATAAPINPDDMGL
jgi:hypothetical protein